MSKKILVVDDEKLVTDSLTILLKKAGFDPDVTNSGSQALEKVKESDYDLIVSDIRMPDMDGVEVIKRIRSLLSEAGRSPVPEILITGYASEESMKDAQDLDVADYIYKPFNINDFLETVKRNVK